MIKAHHHLLSWKAHWSHLNHLLCVPSSSVTNAAAIKCSAALHICRYINETRWPHCSPGRPSSRGSSEGASVIALFSTVKLPFNHLPFSTPPPSPVASGQSRSLTRPCFINILSYFLTVGSPCDTFRSLWYTALANYVNTTGGSRWFQAALC